MRQEIIITGDGSSTIRVPELNISYHSKHGAIQESQHVFIKAGLNALLGTTDELSVFEMGFGTGLNALLTFIEAEKAGQNIYYETVEAFPIDNRLVSQLNYTSLLERPDLQNIFSELHQSTWNNLHQPTSFFSFYKHNDSLIAVTFKKKYHLIYFDAFDPLTQPELWTSTIFKKLYDTLLPGGLLLTYCSKTIVRHAMQEAGFVVEKIPGPIGKREIVRAKKE